MRRPRLLAASPGSKGAARDVRANMVRSAALALILNLVYAVYHGVVGMMTRSWWFSALWGYYTVLGVTRFVAVLCGRRKGASLETEIFVGRVIGGLFLLLDGVLAGVNYLSLREETATRYGTITMIAIATYTFGKLTLALVRAVRHRRAPAPLLAAIRTIGYGEAAVSVLTLQRSMLVSFGEAAPSTRSLMNALTGAGVFLLIGFLGIRLLRKQPQQYQQYQQHQQPGGIHHEHIEVEQSQCASG